MTEESVILLVEDNESHAILAIRGLSQYHKKPRIACKRRRVLWIIFGTREYSCPRSNPRPRKYADLRLPKIDGLDVLKEMKSSEDLRVIPVVILTSSMAEPDIVRSYYYNANSYLVKPLDFEEFRKEMLCVANYWLNWNINPL